ncbi:MAG: 5-methylcytosine restriction system specificity protein McrC [Opitutaceae bacterium]
MESKIPVENLYYLLCYSWDRLEEGELAAVDSEACDTLQDLLAKVLVSGTQRLIKQGFHRGYQEKVEETSSLRGRIAFSPSLRQLSWTKGRMVCEFTELSYNTLPNRILKTTLRNLLYTSGINNERKDQIAGILHHLHEVSPIRITSKLFKRIQYHQNLRYYRFLMNICELVHDCLIPKEGNGESQFRDFLRDHQKMAAMFEEFVRNFYKRESQFKVGNKQYSWQGFEGDETTKALLPTLNTDVELRSGNALTIMDCKFYHDAFTNNRDTQRFKTANLYQLYAYIMNRQLKEPELKISGMLLYPETEESFCHRFKLQGHAMCIASINLSQPWQEIHDDLLALVSEQPESTQNQQSLDPIDLEDAITTCALRFMGYEYWEERHHAFEGAHAGDFSALTTDLIKTGRLHDNDNDNLCAFFILQRYLCKMGGDQLREDSPERIVYYRLFLHCYKLEIPDAFKHSEYQGKWIQGGLINHEAIADQVRQQKLSIPDRDHGI